jgi:hypothetical protein
MAIDTSTCDISRESLGNAHLRHGQLPQPKLELKTFNVSGNRFEDSNFRFSRFQIRGTSDKSASKPTSKRTYSTSLGTMSIQACVSSTKIIL